MRKRGPRSPEDPGAPNPNGDRSRAPRTCSAGEAFTLIELLIVVAIIAILAAIAVPNFLEAQTRSKVARVQSDMRTLSGALQAFYVDHGWFIFSGGERFQHIVDPMWSLPGWYTPPQGYPEATLTTPVAYISSVLFDVFAKPRTISSGMSEVSQQGGGWMYGTDRTLKRAFCLESFGPDGVGSLPDAGGRDWGCFATMYDEEGPQETRRLFLVGMGVTNYPGAYDASNGTRSDGDIVRFSE